MKALNRSVFFAVAKLFLCRWHINTNVVSMTKDFFSKAKREADGTVIRNAKFSDFLKA